MTNIHNKNTKKLKHKQHNKSHNKNKNKEKSHNKRHNQTHNKTKQNKTHKNKLRNIECIDAVLPFEHSYNRIRKTDLILPDKEINNIFMKEVTAIEIPKNVKPQNDFYGYVNYKWMKSASNVSDDEKYIVRKSDFTSVQHKVYEELDKLILNYIKHHHNNMAKNIDIFRKSIISMNSPSNSKRIAKDYVQLIDNFISEDNPWKLLAYYGKREMIRHRGPFVLNFFPEPGDPDVVNCWLFYHNFESIDNNVYNIFDKTSQSLINRTKYISFVRKIFDTTLGKGHGLKPRDVLDVEIEFINAIEYNKSYDKATKVKASESLNKYGFDWITYTKELGFKTPPPYFLTYDLGYLKRCTKLFIDNWKTPKWRTFWLFILLANLCRITNKWREIVYEFYGNHQRGQQKIVTNDAVNITLYMSLSFGNWLSKEYLRYAYNKDVVTSVINMGKDLSTVFKRIVSRNEWLSTSTKQRAIRKLEKINLVVGNDENMGEDPVLSYSSNFYDNLEKICDSRFKKQISIIGKKSLIVLPDADWNDYPAKLSTYYPYVVNASYTPSKNQIFMNLGVLQPPFIDLTKRIEYNLAGIGFIISHEMSHSLDNNGSKYDENGKLYDWWTPRDKKIFKRITRDVEKQYEEFLGKDKYDFDASLSLGEDIADISSVAIISEYLKDYIIYMNKDSLIATNIFQNFFIYYAIHHQSYEPAKATIPLLLTNPHPPNKYRCNIPLSRSTIFRKIYDVKKGNGMWWHNTNTIW